MVEEATSTQEVSGSSHIPRVFGVRIFGKIKAKFNGKYVRSTLSSTQNM